MIEAYAAEPSRATLQRGPRPTKSNGAGFELRVMAAHGGTISIEANELATHARLRPDRRRRRRPGWLAEQIDLANVLCTDIGGTSFDIALITDGRFEITTTPDIARFVLNMPLVRDRLDRRRHAAPSCASNPNSNRPELGPDSAGARIGAAWPRAALETVSITDLNLVLGRLNPEYFLGGEVELDVERARASVERQVAAAARPRRSRRRQPG